MLNVYNPFDLSVIQELPFHTAKDIEHAIATAYAAFQDRKRWLPKYEIITILEKTIDIMSSRKEELTKIAASEGGKPYIDSLVEVNRAINGVKLAIEEMGTMGGKQIPMGHTPSSTNRMAYTFREPIGVVSSISAFNHPLNLIIHQTVPAIAAGCPVIIKPALTTPLSCLAFVDILREAGLPKEWCQAIVCENEDAEKLVTDTRVNYLSFIGSAKVGWYLRSKVAPGTRVALEHGGAAPVIVDESADLEDMIPALLKGGFYHAGQVCVSVQRVFIHEAHFQTVADKFTAGANALKTGDQLLKDTEAGPLILPREVDRVDSWVKEAIAEGAQITAGGNKISDTCFEPTVLLNPSPSSKVSQQEIFGPVVCLYSYKSREQAIDQANNIDYHFQASVFSKNIDIAMDTVQKLNATAVMVNDHTAFRVDWMPFGGRDSSGLGLGGIPYSMHEMTRDKLMVIKSQYL